MNEKERRIALMINHSIKGKMPTSASSKDWGRYHHGFTRQEMTARDMAANIYKGYSFCPVYEGRRKQSNFREAWYIAFDFDDNGIDDLQTVAWVDFFLAFAYSTPSHLPESPKCRAVFIFDTPITNADRYRTLYNALAWWFKRDGLQTDPSCKDIIRLYYGSPKCDVWPNWSILPEGAQDYFIASYREHNPPKAMARPQFSRPQNITEATIQRALQFIPPAGDYHDWLTVLMAVHSAMPNDAGVSLCETWSSGYEGEIARKFKSFDQGGANNVNIGSLFHLAKQYGYQPKQGQRGRNSNHQEVTARLNQL